MACALGALLALSIVLSLGFGANMLPLDQVVAGLRQGLGGPATSPTAHLIVWQLRLPRTLLAVIVGAGLAIAGASIQTLAQNPLADPYLLGVSSGASVGATAVIAGGLGALGGRLALTGGALVGALAASVLVFGVAQLQGGLTPLRLVLTGTILSSAFSSLSSCLIFVSGNQQAAQAVLFWLLGTLSGAQWSNLLLPAIVTLVLGIVLYSLSGWLDALANGAQVAIALGVPVTQLRIALFVIQAVLVGVLVASSGGIGFVGLVMPHLARLLVGGRHRVLFPIAALIGAVFMVWVDVITRILVAPVEIPASVVTGLIGAPIFLVLLGRRTYEFGSGS
nr:iron ABC transporter permease [Propionibacterium cyclohexanicum]